jgi:8-oxo-dGTP pyrophosphatase MutT (NUDIX family)
MRKIIEKVTAFVTRQTDTGVELLLFEHPNAGIQLPAGTVNDGETPEETVQREVAEETGLTDVIISQYLGSDEEALPGNQRVILAYTRVYARPELNSFDWAYIRPGIMVAVTRRAAGFTQILYQEYDRVPDPHFVTMSIQGWVPDEVLANTRLRHFYHLDFTGQSKDRWRIAADNHTFSLFWTPLTHLPEIIPPQNGWLAYLRQVFRI